MRSRSRKRVPPPSSRAQQNKGNKDDAELQYGAVEAAHDIDGAELLLAAEQKGIDVDAEDSEDLALELDAIAEEDEGEDSDAAGGKKRKQSAGDGDEDAAMEEDGSGGDDDGSGAEDAEAEGSDGDDASADDEDMAAAAADEDEDASGDGSDDDAEQDEQDDDDEPAEPQQPAKKRRREAGKAEERAPERAQAAEAETAGAEAETGAKEPADAEMKEKTPSKIPLGAMRVRRGRWRAHEGTGAGGADCGWGLAQIWTQEDFDKLRKIKEKLADAGCEAGRRAVPLRQPGLTLPAFRAASSANARTGPRCSPPRTRPRWPACAAGALARALLTPRPALQVDEAAIVGYVKRGRRDKEDRLATVAEGRVGRCALALSGGTAARPARLLTLCVFVCTERS
jgi:hypothetical protein